MIGRIIFYSLFFVLSYSQRRDETGGVNCIACTIVVGALITPKIEKSQDLLAAKRDLCSNKQFEGICHQIFDQVAPMIQSKMTPDEVCRFLKICKDPKCNLYPIRKNPTPITMEKFNPDNNIWDIIMKWIQSLIKKIAEDRKPILDVDNDAFSGHPGLRGSSWRGKDCDDSKSDIYPGRKSSRYDTKVDHNCNGIHGVNHRNQSYEEMFCSGNNQPRGVIVIGDSASANFYIPIIGSEEGTLEKFIETALNEGDAPQCSWATGHAKNKDCPFSPWPRPLPDTMQSFYMKLRNRNRCNHRDFQNISVNGARSGAVASGIIKAIARDQKFDHPVILFLSLYANDVCSPHAGDVPMTKPEVFERNIKSILSYLDTRLPNGSYVFSTGLFNGELMFDKMAKKIHPNLNCTYEHLWDYVGCMGSNACWGWLNKNETWRRFTTNRAQELNSIYPKLVREQNYQNFKYEYIGSFFRDSVRTWEQMGGDPKYLFQPIDGGHPGQLHQNLKAQKVFEFLEQRYPNSLGPINPHNSEIDRLFKEQGGH